MRSHPRSDLETVRQAHRMHAFPRGAVGYRGIEWPYTVVPRELYQEKDLPWQIAARGVADDVPPSRVIGPDDVVITVTDSVPPSFRRFHLLQVLHDMELEHRGRTRVESLIGATRFEIGRFLASGTALGTQIVYWIGRRNCADDWLKYWRARLSHPEAPDEIAAIEAIRPLYKEREGPLFERIRRLGMPEEEGTAGIPPGMDSSHSARETAGPASAGAVDAG